MSWGEEERDIGQSYAERNELDRKLEGQRGDCWCECEKCGHHTLGNSDSFVDGKNKFCYRCENFYCQECFPNHECKSKAGIELTILRDRMIREKEKTEISMHREEEVVKAKRGKIRKLKRYIKKANEGLEKDSVNKGIFVKTMEISRWLRTKVDF